MNGPAPALPEQCFSFLYPDHFLASPTFSPDGSAVAWNQAPRPGDTRRWDIVVGQVPDQSAGCQLPSAGATTIIEDAITPDWSPAPVPTLQEAPPAGPAGPQTPPPGAQPQPPANPRPGAAPKPRVTIAPRPLARTLARGLVLNARVPSAGTLKVTVRRAGRVVATGTVRARRAGRVNLTARFTGAAKRSLRRVRSATLTVQFRFTSRAGVVTGRVRATVRR